MTYRRNKYGNHKVVSAGIKFDSKAEAAYLPVARAYAKKHGLELRLQEAFELQPGYKLSGRRKQAIKYIPDFTFWDGDKLVKVVDVKGKQTADFRVKAKLFCYKYQIPLILAEYDYKKRIFYEREF